MFGTLDDTFFTERNFTNLLLQMAHIATIAIGVVFVLLIGEIDLSVAFVSAVGGVTMTLLLRPASPTGRGGPPLPLGCRDHLHRPAAGAGDHQGGRAVVRRHAGGTVHLVRGRPDHDDGYSTSGTIRIQDDTVIGIANDFLSDAAGWVVGAVGIAAYALSQALTARSCRARGLDAKPGVVIVLQVAGLAAVTFAAV